MIKFYKSVDLRSRKKMTDFLQNHFRYYTMNSWNRSQSYACNLKITGLGLSPEIVNKLFDMIETQEFFAAMKELQNEFDASHNYLWQVGMNGRSGGYLVLYQGESKPSEYRSYCVNCGQRNYKSVAESGAVCGACGQPMRIDYSKPPLNICTFPGRGTDDNEDFELWDMYELRQRVMLVQDFDRLADAMVLKAIELAKSCTVEEMEYFVPQTKKVLVSCT